LEFADFRFGPVRAGLHVFQIFLDDLIGRRRRVAVLEAGEHVGFHFGSQFGIHGQIPVGQGEEGRRIVPQPLGGERMRKLDDVVKSW